MSVEKFNASAKRASGKWWSYLRAVKFDDGGVSITVSVKQAEKLLEDLKNGELAIDSYGYAKLSLYPDTPRDGQAPKSEVPF